MSRVNLAAEPMVALPDGSIVYLELFMYISKLLAAGFLVDVVDSATVIITPQVEWRDAEPWLSEHADDVAAILAARGPMTVQ